MRVNLIRHVEFEKNGKSVKRHVMEYTRGGEYSPSTYYILEGNRFISPFEQRVRGWKWTFASFFGITYQFDLLKKEMSRRSWLLDAVEKDDGWKGGVITVPLVPLVKPLS